MQSTLLLVKFLRFIASFAASVGIKREAMRKFKNETEEALLNADILQLPDRFNAAFANQGWIATGSLSLDIMRSSVALHNDGKLDEAESAILEWFTEDNIRTFAIIHARRFHEANLRDEQLREALRLYLEERYMSAVPLILIACDGFASDVSGTSPFEKNADLTCFDSIVGHRTSLPVLLKLFVQGVRKSSDAELSIPKRHGILHGRSLGYANKIVCAKAWLLMVALVDWAADKSSEEARIEERRKKDSVSLLDLIRQSRRIQNNKKIIEAFRPSESSGPFIGPYDADTAEYAVLEFLEGWKSRNFGRMAKHVINFTKKSEKKMAGEVREMVERVSLDEYEVVRIRYSTVARCDVRVRVEAKTMAKTIAGEFQLFLLHYTADGDVAMPADHGCTWAVQQNWIYNVVNENFADPI